ncbi:MAG: hypothetical protein Q9213_001565 [Squamulea squamosa]
MAGLAERLVRIVCSLRKESGIERATEHVIALVNDTIYGGAFRSESATDFESRPSCNNPPSSLWSGTAALNIKFSLQCILRDFTEVSFKPLYLIFHQSRHNKKLIRSHSANLLPMPGEKWDITARFPFHMTHSTVGVVFSNYDHFWFIPNLVIDQLLNRASQAVRSAIEANPSLEHRPITQETRWEHEHEDLALFLEPDVPNVTWGDMDGLFHLLGIWAHEYKTEACSFEIWQYPGMHMAKRLGMGHILGI